MKRDQLHSLLLVHKAMNLTFLRFTKLRAFFQNDWDRVWKEGNETNLLSAGIDKIGIARFLENKKNTSLDDDLAAFEKQNIQVLVYGEDGYPLRLANIHTPPVVLFCRGKLLDSDTRAVSLVGTRAPTSYAKRVIDFFVSDFVSSGITIVSGLALGVDTLAHKSAVENKGRTIAVLGNGIDHIHPSGNQFFAQKYIEKEQLVLLSEYFPGMRAMPEYFPVRNRIIAGISHATIVIEAAEKSGSLITANFALEEGKDVFAVPGDIFSKNSKGTNILLSLGAHPAISPSQVLEVLGWKKNITKNNVSLPATFSDTEKKILLAFGNEQRLHINDLIRASNLSSATVSAQLSLLEIKGVVRNIGNQIFEK